LLTGGVGVQLDLKLLRLVSPGVQVAFNAGEEPLLLQVNVPVTSAPPLTLLGKLSTGANVVTGFTVIGVVALLLGALSAAVVPVTVTEPLVGAVPLIVQTIEAPAAKLLTGGVGVQLDLKLLRFVSPALQVAFNAGEEPLLLQVNVPVTSAPPLTLLGKLSTGANVVTGFTVIGVVALLLGALSAAVVPVTVTEPFAGAVPEMLQTIEAPAAKLLTGGVGVQLDVKLLKLVSPAVQVAFSAGEEPLLLQVNVPVTSAPPLTLLGKFNTGAKVVTGFTVIGVLALLLGALSAAVVPVTVTEPFAGAVPLIVQFIEAPAAKLPTGGVGEQLYLTLLRLVVPTVQVAFTAGAEPVFVQVNVPDTAEPPLTDDGKFSPGVSVVTGSMGTLV
jgi:hypothetical protein